MKCVLSGAFFILFLCAFANGFAHNEPRFTENKGQLPNQVEYNLEVANADVFFEKNRIRFNFYNPELRDSHHHGETQEHHGSLEYTGHNYDLVFLDANAEAQVVATGDKFPDYINYIKSDKQIPFVHAYNEISYSGIYDGIDIRYFGSEGHLKYDVIVEAGADVSRFKMQYNGASSLSLKGDKLVVVNTFNTVEESIPLAYQIINGKQVEVACEYRLDGTTVSFNFPEGYDSNYKLVIDPTLIFSSYSGSTTDNFGFTATYDAAGALYGGGIAFSFGYPTTVGAYSTAYSGLVDMAISKFSPDGTTLLYSTYIGGANTDAPHSMVVNNQNELVILGSSSSLDYPTSTNAYDGTFNGGTPANYSSNGTNYQNGSDIVVTILSADGSAIVGSTYLGGTENDGLNEDTDLTYNYGDIFRGEVIVDDADNIYINTSTGSPDLPVTSGTVGQSLGGIQDACVARFNSDVSSLDWCTFLGGDGADAGYSMKLNNANEIYLTGGTEGQGFPTTGGTLNTTYQGGQADGFVARLSNDATTLINSSYIGTSEYDQTYFVEVDHDDDVYLYGQSSGSYPVVGSPYSNLNGKQFIQKLSPDLSTSVMSMVFGSGTNEVNISPTAFLVDICKRVYISGWGGGTNNFWNNATGTTDNMPTTPDGFQLTTDGSDFYFMVLEADAASLLYATYFGGDGINEHVDGGTSRFNSDGVIHQAVCAGCGNSDDFPTTPGVVSNTNNSQNCNLGVIKLDLEIPLVDVGFSIDTTQTGCVPFEVQFTADTLVAPEFMWYFGNGDSSNLANPTYIFDTPGTFEVLLVGSNVNCQGNQFVDTARITINAVLNGDSVSAGPDQQICPGDSVQLNGFGGVDYTWSPSQFLSNENAEDPIAFPDVSTEFVVQVLNAEGCAAFDTVLVEVGVLNLNLAGDTTICFGDTTQLVAGGAATYSWSPNQDIDDVTIANPSVWPSSTTLYVLEAETADGCQGADSVLVQVQSLPTANAGADVSVCDGESVQLIATGGVNYNWNPSSGLNNTTISNPNASPSNTTTYTVIVSDNIGCSDSDSVEVTVNPLTVVDAGPDRTLCQGQLVQFSASGAITYQWTPSTGLSNPNVFNPVASPIVPTTYTVEGTDANGCSATDDVFVDVFVVEATGDSEICRGDSTQLGAIGGVSWNWVPVAGLSSNTAQNPMASPFNTTVYVVIADDGAGCSATDSVTVVVNPLPNASAGPDFEICIGESVVLQGSGGGDYLWTPSTFLDDPAQQLPISTPSQTQEYVLQVTSLDGCLQTDTMEVIVNNLPLVDAGPDSLICAGETLLLQASGADTYLWSPLVGLDDPQSQNPIASPQSNTTYFVTGTDVNGCTGTDSVSITIFGVNPNSGNYVICLNDSVMAPVNGGSSYLWNPTAGVSDSSSSNPFLSPTENTDYNVTVTSEFGCEAQTLVQVQVLPLPVAAFSGSFEPACEGIYAQFDNQSENADGFWWSFGNGASSSELNPNYIFEPGPGTEVTLYVYNNDSLCSDSVTIDYSNQWFGNDSIEVDYSNIFTPNFDGINDCFKPEFEARFDECYELYVYNRWGALIFESTAGQNHCWDGRTKGGIMVEEGTYYYISKIRGIDNAGYVTVIYQ